ncbi:MAG: hypothetical protein AABZ11_09850 [Nitrospinota bacterium]
MILDSAEVEEFSIVVVTEKPAISSGWLSVGIPAKSNRKLVKLENGLYQKFFEER